jgi:hypothetical protein
MLGTTRDQRFDFDKIISIDRAIYFYSIDPWHMNNPDHISESLETIFWVKILKFFYADPGSGMEKIRIRDGKNLDPGSGMEKIRIRDPRWIKFGSG